MEVAIDMKACIPCEANPFKLLCCCPGCRHSGICSHIMAATHVLMRDHFPAEKNPICNVTYMIKRLCLPRKAHRPRKPRGALVIEDSSDEEEANLEASMLVWG